MNLREQFEKEEGWFPSTAKDRIGDRYKNDYIKWLEERIETINFRIFNGTK